MLPILICGYAALLGGCAFMMARNQWVYCQRTRLNDQHYEAVKALIASGLRDMPPWWDTAYLTYDQMMWRFWIWDVERLRKPAALEPSDMERAA